MSERHVALCSGGGDSVAATHAAMTFGPAEEVVHLNTGTGPGDGAVADNEQWIREWCEDMGWPFRSIATPVDYEEWVGQNGTPGPRMHLQMYGSLKDRQLCQLASETDGELHCWTGIRRSESQNRMEVADAEGVRGEGRWYWHSPLINWSDERVEEYRERFDIPVSTVTEEIGRSADCWCGCFGDRNELIDLAAAGYEDHADWLEGLETPDDVPREQQKWAGYNWEKSDWAADDDAQLTLCSSCGADYPIADGGTDITERGDK